MSVQYLLTLAAASCLLASGFVVARRWPLLLLLPIAILVITAWEFPNAGFIGTVFGTRLFLQDLLAIVFLLDVLYRLSRGIKKPTVVIISLAVVGAVGLVSTLRGLTLYSLGATANEVRPLAYSLCGSMWAFAVGQSLTGYQVHIVKRGAIAVGWVLVIVAMYHLFRYGLGDSTSSIEEDGLAQTGRPLIAAQAFVLAVILFLALTEWASHEGSKYLFSALAFSIVVVIAQHRSVWVSGLVALGLLIGFSNKVRRTKVLAALIVSLWITLISYLLGGLNPVLSKLTESATNDKTLLGREGSTAALLAQALASGTRVLFFGYPFGSGFRRQEALGRVVDYTPHNWYLHIFLRVGVVGLLALVLILVSVLVRALHTSALALAILSAITVFGWSYSIPWYVVAMMGGIAGFGQRTELFARRRRKHAVPNQEARRLSQA